MIKTCGNCGYRRKSAYDDDICGKFGYSCIVMRQFSTKKGAPCDINFSSWIPKEHNWLKRMFNSKQDNPKADDLEKLHSSSFRNKIMINSLIRLDPKEKSLRVGCFYCRSIMFPSRIREFTADEIAICPICHIDSIIKLNEHDSLDKSNNLINKMFDKYFGDI